MIWTRHCFKTLCDVKALLQTDSDPNYTLKVEAKWLMVILLVVTAKI